MDKKLIIANWKMNPETSAEALRLLKALGARARLFSKIKLAICPPMVFLPMAAEYVHSFGWFAGAQNISESAGGLHTGEVSAVMIKSLGVSYVIIGHSERRAMGETDGQIREKLLQALAARLVPVVAIGEKEKGEDAHKIIANQLKDILADVSRAKMGSVVFAYEPRWAISSGPNDTVGFADTPEDAKEKMLYIRRVLASMYNPVIARRVKILYGGSVRAKNIKTFLCDEPSFDGVLVGGASLNVDKFAMLVKEAGTRG